MAIALHVDTPRPFEANPGIVSLRTSQPVDRLVVLVDGKPYRTVALLRPSKRVTIGPLGLPTRDLRLTIRAYRGDRLVGRKTVGDVLGLPASSFAVGRSPRLDRRAQRALARLPRPPGISAAWVAALAGGTGAARNAGASFTAASTVKLPILLAALADLRRDVVGTPLWGPLERMIRSSSNDAANEVLIMMSGSTEAGGARATRVARLLGATRTDVAAGFLPGQDRRANGIPATVLAQPEVPCCKTTTARDLGVMLRALVLAAAGRGPGAAIGLTPRDARVALWLLAHTTYRGLIDPWTPYPTAFKEGFVDRAWHEAAIVFTPEGPIAIAIMTDNPGGASEQAAAQYGRGIYRIARRTLAAP